jgi:hypothetical protein
MYLSIWFKSAIINKNHLFTNLNKSMMHGPLIIGQSASLFVNPDIGRAPT